MSDLFGNHIVDFSHEAVHIIDNYMHEEIFSLHFQHYLVILKNDHALSRPSNRLTCSNDNIARK